MGDFRPFPTIRRFKFLFDRIDALLFGIDFKDTPKYLVDAFGVL
jgi:hypothetical protein